MHVQAVEQTPRPGLGTHDQQRMIGFIIVFGHHVSGQALLLHHPTAQREAQLCAERQGLLAQAVQTRLLRRQFVAHARMPVAIGHTLCAEDDATVGTDGPVREWKLHPLIRLNAARSHGHHVGGGQQPLDKALLRRIHKAIGLALRIERGGVARPFGHFAGGLKQRVIEVNEHQRAINGHKQ